MLRRKSFRGLAPAFPVREIISLHSNWRFLHRRSFSNTTKAFSSTANVFAVQERRFPFLMFLRHLFAKSDHSDAPPAFGMWCRLEVAHMGMMAQQFGNCLPERTGSYAMNDADRIDLSQEGVIQKLIG